MSAPAAVVTGFGCVSPYGAGAIRLWRGLVAGEIAFRPLTLFDASPYRNNRAGQVPIPDAQLPAAASRAEAFLRLAVREAAADAALAGVDPRRIGVSLGTNFGGAQAGIEALRRYGTAKDAAGLGAARIGAGLAAAREEFFFAGPSSVLSLACASAAAAIGEGLSWLRAGRADVVLAGGFDELSEHCYAGLSALRAITKETVRPFDVRRSGTLFSEGAALLVLETEAHARARARAPRARLLGAAANNDAFHMTAPDQTASGIAAVMRQALADAALPPEAIDHLNCHGTGTQYNDRIETAAAKTVFGPHARTLLLTSHKGAIGHGQGAAGAFEAIGTVQALATGLVPPTAGLEEADPELDLDYCPGRARPAALRAAMSNSYGMGGTNASLVFAHAPHPETP